MWAWCGLAAAQTVAPSRDITLIEGRGELLRFQSDIARVVISEPKVADAVVVSPREVMVNAKGAGHTTLMVWEGGAEPARWEVASPRTWRSGTLSASTCWTARTAARSR